MLIMSHPTPWEFHPVHHPSYIDFFEQVLAETTDPVEIEAKYEKAFAEDEWYRHLYRTSLRLPRRPPVLHVVLGRHALQHLGGVIVVGGDVEGRAPARLQARVDPARRASRWPPTSSGRDPSITHLHNPPHPPGRRDVKVRFAPTRLVRALPFPYRAPTMPRRRRAAADQAPHGRRLRHRLGPPLAGPRRPGWCSSNGVMRPGVRGAGSPECRGLDRLERRSRARRSSPPTTTATSTRRCCSRRIPEPWRHQIVRRRGRRLLLRQPGHLGRSRPWRSAPSPSSAPRSAAARPTRPPS